VKDKNDKSQDTFVEDRLTKYDKYVRERRIPFSSKVVPVDESLTTQQWVLPTEQVIELLRNARSFALLDCVCRSHFGRCDNPVDVCFRINDAGDAAIAQGIGRQVSLEEAKDTLGRAAELGLIHLAIYNPEQYVYAVCSCCSCCCHDLQFLKQFGRDDLIARSEYIAHTDPDVCTHCGDCIEPCIFEARTWDDERMRFDAGACHGCGLCVPV
jgi:hypothetical protein